MSVRQGSLWGVYLIVHEMLVHQVTCAVCQRQSYAMCSAWWGIWQKLVSAHDAVAEEFGG